MFDLITDTRERPLRERSLTSKIVATVFHIVVVTVVIVVPLLRAANQLPPIVPTMMAFVAPMPVAPPPPPPPPPAASPVAQASPQPARTTGQFAAPIEAPPDVRPERASAHDEAATGVLGGVEGGVPGGVVGGIVGGIVSPVAPPPPPPPPPPAAVVARAPVRIGGQITAPALLHRVEPIYPDVAAIAHLTGMVILEATVDTEGCVESVRILRARHLLLDSASRDALLQWRYSPLVLNGIPTPFVLTVTFNFSVKQ